MLVEIPILYLLSVSSVYSFVLGLELSYLRKRGGAVGVSSIPLANRLKDTSLLGCGLLYLLYYTILYYTILYYTYTYT